MGDGERVYRLTQTGRDAWESQDVAVPADYRRMLWLMDFHGHAGVIRDLLRQYPKHVLDEWLAEMEELGLIEQTLDPQETEAAFSSREADKTQAMDQSRVRREADTASASLARTGAYIAADRLSQRPSPNRAPADSVVLIVEDDPDQLALADLRVTMAGYQVRVAESGQALKETLRAKGLPDILLLDVMLPDADGFAILAGMRRHPKLALLPVIMLTAKDDPADISKGLALGADGYVTKPYSRNILADTIRRVLMPAPSK